ncbi:MAG: T9SS type A sorting domain-containing protein [Bacteroidota bacterium]
MKLTFRLLFCLSFPLVILTCGLKAQNSLHGFKVKNIGGDSSELSLFAGKRLMIVNTASFCGYTTQFAQLQQLYQNYQQYNFEILGFPCNDFGNQDPNSDSAIFNFCTNNYNVSFPMMSRIEIVAADTAPLYRWLQRSDLNGVAIAQVTWNFNKCLIDENGQWVQHFVSNVNPLSSQITSWIMQNPSLAASSANKQAPAYYAGGQFFPGDFRAGSYLEIFSAQGKLQSQTMLHNNSPVQVHLPAGFYIARLSGNNQAQTIRFVHQP